MKNSRLVIVDGVRTPFCKAGTELASLGADELGRIAVNALLTRTGLDPELVDEVIFGCVAQPVDATNVARVIALRAGIPDRFPPLPFSAIALPVAKRLRWHRNDCSPGAARSLLSAEPKACRTFRFCFNQRTAEKFGRLSRAQRTRPNACRPWPRFGPSDFQPRIGLMLGLTDPVCGMNMGETAEVLAREFGIYPRGTGRICAESHQRAVAAQEKLGEEICPAFLTAKATAATKDNGPRENQSTEALAKLKPVFDRRTGTVTAGNASQITDGAVALLVMSEEKAERLGYRSVGRSDGLRLCGLRSVSHGPRPGLCNERSRGNKPA